MKPKKILLLALLSGLITTVIFISFINQPQPTPAKQPEMVSVVTASQDIDENQRITEEDITMVEVPETQVHPQAIKDKAIVLEKVTSASIKTGEAIMLHRLQEPSEEAKIISKKIQEGFQAVSISVDFVKSVSNLIEPGDLVDVVLTEVKNNGGEEAVNTEIILEKVKVLAVGQRMVEKKEGEAPVEYISVTLELKQEDSVEVIEASAKGSLQLTLHSKLLPAGRTNEAEGNQASEGEVVLPTGETNIIVTPTHSLIRSKPSLSATIINVVNSGTTLRYLEEKARDEEERLWLWVETPDNEKGWISSRIIKQENE